MGIREDAEALKRWMETDGVARGDGYTIVMGLAELTIELHDIPTEDRRLPLLGILERLDLVPLNASQNTISILIKKYDHPIPTRFMNKHERRYVDFLRKNELTHRLILVRLDPDGGRPLGGRGRRGTYHLERIPISSALPAVVCLPPEHDQDTYSHVATTSGIQFGQSYMDSSSPPTSLLYVLYHEEETSDILLSPKGIGTFGKGLGFAWRSRAGIIYRLRRLLPFLSLILAALLFEFVHVFDPKPISIRDLLTVLSIGLLLAFAWNSKIRPLHILKRRRVVFLDEEYLQKGQDPALIQRIGHGQNEVLKVSRYQATCPICTGKIILDDGEPEWPGRIVGRCGGDPLEHVYTFDRVTLTGWCLRTPPWMR